MSSPVSHDHAADAAKLLRRLAIFVAFVVTPAVALFSRTSTTIALPVTAMLLFFATLVDPERQAAAPRLRGGLASPLILVVLYVAVWFTATLAWTPFPATAAGRLAETLAVAAAGAGAVFALPEKMRASTLNLIPIGAFLCALLLAGVSTAALLDLSPVWLRPDRIVLERGMAALALFAFIGAGWLLSRGRRIDALALLVVVVVAFAAQASIASALAFGLALAVFLLARVAPGLAAALVVLLAAASLMATPLLPLLVETVGFDWTGRDPREIEAAKSVATRIAGEWTRYIGGYGFDSFRFAQRAAILPRDPSRAPHLDLWFEAGLPAAASMLAGAWLAARWAVRSPAGVGAATLAVLAAGIAYAAIGSPVAPRGYGLTQNWWLSTVALAVLGLASIARGQFRTRRPRLRDAAPRPATSPVPGV